MSRAEDLFARLKAGGHAALDKLIDDREPESLFLDFKGSKDPGTGQKLNTDDNKNVSKGISGFGNSEGGLLVWGVDCRRDAAGVEVASKKPLHNVLAFQGKVEGAISRVTLPPHPGVQTATILDPSSPDSGYLAVLVPQSSIGPMRSTETNHYHVRAGSNFEIIGHDVLAGMFGRSPRPKLDLNFISMGMSFDTTKAWLNIPINIVGVNISSVIVGRPYLSIWLRDYPKEHFQWSCPRQADYHLREGTLPGFSMVGKEGVCLPPNASEDLCNIVIQMPVAHLRDFEIELTSGGNGTAPNKCTIKGSVASIRQAISTLNGGKGALSTDVLQVVH